MSGTLRLVPAIFLLICSSALWMYAQHGEPPSTEKAKEEAGVQRDKAIDKFAETNHMSREEAERKIDAVQKIMDSPNADPSESRKSSGKSGTFENPVPPAKSKGKIELKDVESGHHVNWISTTSPKRPSAKVSESAVKSVGVDPVADELDSNTGNKKTPTETNSHKDADAQSEHHAHEKCEGLQGTSLDECLEEVKKASTGAK
jgi:hypothetical protein